MKTAWRKLWDDPRLQKTFGFAKTLPGAFIIAGGVAGAIISIKGVINTLDPPDPVISLVLGGYFSVPGGSAGSDIVNLFLNRPMTAGIKVHLAGDEKTLSSQNYDCSLALRPDDASLRKFFRRSMADTCEYHVTDEPIFFSKTSRPRQFRFGLKVSSPAREKPASTDVRTLIFHDFTVPVIYMPAVVALGSQVPAKILFDGERPADVTCIWSPGTLFTDMASCNTTFKAPDDLTFYPDAHIPVSATVTVHGKDQDGGTFDVDPQAVIVSLSRHMSKVAKAVVKHAPPVKASEWPSSLPVNFSQTEQTKRAASSTLAGLTNKPPTIATNNNVRPTAKQVAIQPVSSIIRSLGDSKDVSRYDKLSVAIISLSRDSKISVSEALNLLGSIQEPARNDALLHWLLPHIVMPLTGNDSVRLLGGADGYDRAALLESLSPCIKRPIAPEVRDQILETIQGFARQSAEDVLDKGASCSAGDGKGS